MTDKLRELLEDVRTVYEGKGMVVYPNSFSKLIEEIMKLDNINRLQKEQIEKMKCCSNCSKVYVRKKDGLVCCSVGSFHINAGGKGCEEWELAE